MSSTEADPPGLVSVERVGAASFVTLDVNGAVVYLDRRMAAELAMALGAASNDL